MKLYHILLLALVAALIGGLLAHGPAGAQNLGDFFDEGERNLERTTGFLEILFYIIGIVLIGVGIMRFKRHSDHPQQASLGSAVVVVLVGVALIGLPALGSAVLETFGANQNTTIDRPKLN